MVMEQIYQDGTYLDLHETWHSEDSPWKASQIEKIIQQNQLKFESLVEVGCGAGQILYEMSQKFPTANISGFDISVQAAKFWQQLPPSQINFQVGDFLLTKEHFDLLLLIDVFEHVPDYISFLKNLTSRADYFIFNIPLDMHILGVLIDHQIQARKQYGHLHYFSKATALRTLEDCGYSIVDWFYAPGFADTPPESSLKTTQRKLLYPLRKLLFTLSPELNAKFLGGASLLVLATTQRA